jgi:hypothetical protein
MSEDLAELSEFARVEKETSKFKIFRRALGFGSASRVIERSLQSAGSSVESVALALLHKQQVSKARSEIRKAPLRVFAATAVLSDVIYFAFGEKTAQGAISDNVAAKSELRRDKSALVAARSTHFVEPVGIAIDRVNRLNSLRFADSGLSKRNILRNDLQNRLLRSNPMSRVDRPVPQAVVNELLNQHDAIFRGRGVVQPLTDETTQYLRDRGLNPNSDPNDNLAGLGLTAQVMKRSATSAVPTTELSYHAEDHMLPQYSSQRDLGLIATGMQTADGRQTYNAPINYLSPGPQINPEMDHFRQEGDAPQVRAGSLHPALPGHRTDRLDHATQRGYDNRDERGRARSSHGR